MGTKRKSSSGNRGAFFFVFAKRCKAIGIDPRVQEAGEAQMLQAFIHSVWVLCQPSLRSWESKSGMWAAP